MVTLSGDYEANGDNVISVDDTDHEGTLIIIDLPQAVYTGKSVSVKLN